MLISVFSCLGVIASAVNAQDLFTVKSSGFKNDKITYTIYLKKGVNLSGAIIYAKFDKDVIAIDEANSGPYMTTDSYGDECYSINGEYVQDYMKGFDNQYSIAHVDKKEYSYKSDRAYMQFTFKAIDANRPETNVKFYCYEFNCNSTPENNIPNGSDNLIASIAQKTLGTTVYTKISNTKNGVSLSWKKTTGADKYEVFRKTTGAYESLYVTENGSVTSYEDKAVSNNVQYTYIVRAINEEGYDNKHGSISIKHIDAPTTIKLSKGSNAVAVSWSKVSGATGYIVYRSTVNANGTKTTPKAVSGKITALSFNDKTAKTGTTYEYSVRVYSNSNYSDLYGGKKIVCLATPDFTVGATVKGVKLSWDKVAGATGYIIHRKVKGGSWSSIKTVSASATSYTDTKAPSGKYVYYRIQAINGSSKSYYDTHALSYLKTPEASLKNTTSGVKISWVKSSGATSYYVYRKAGSAKSWKKIAETKKTSYTDKNVKSGTTYKYCIRAVNSSLKSKYGSSNYEKIRFLAAPELEKIKSTKSGVTIYWDDVKGASGYVIYRKTGSGKYTQLAKVSGKSTVKYTDKSAKKGKKYSYRVYATYSSYKSSYDSSLSIKDKY